MTYDLGEDGYSVSVRQDDTLLTSPLTPCDVTLDLTDVIDDVSMASWS
jgi:hypothetical protein